MATLKGTWSQVGEVDDCSRHWPLTLAESQVGLPRSSPAFILSASLIVNRSFTEAAPGAGGGCHATVLLPPRRVRSGHAGPRRTRTIPPLGAQGHEGPGRRDSRPARHAPRSESVPWRKAPFHAASASCRRFLLMFVVAPALDRGAPRSVSRAGDSSVELT
jgi:hypothetical protein